MFKKFKVGMYLIGLYLLALLVLALCFPIAAWGDFVIAYRNWKADQ